MVWIFYIQRLCHFVFDVYLLFLLVEFSIYKTRLNLINYLGFLLSILGSDGGKQKHWCCSTRDSGGRDGQTQAGDPAVQRLYSNTAAAPAGTGELALRLCGFKSWNLHTQRESVFNIYRCWVKGNIHLPKTGSEMSATSHVTLEWTPDLLLFVFWLKLILFYK